MDQKQFADNLRKAMQRRGVDAPALSECSGVSVSQIYNYLTGGRMPRLDTALRLASALGCRLDELCGRPAQVDRKSVV